MSNTKAKDKVVRVVEVAIEVVGLIIMLLPLILVRGNTKKLQTKERNRTA
jgi:hypothetical protein